MTKLKEMVLISLGSIVFATIGIISLTFIS